MSFLRHLKNIIGFKNLPREQRRLVFYSEGRNYWPHLEGLIRECLAQSDVSIVYVTSDPGDPGLLLEHDSYKSFDIGEGWVRILFFEAVDTDVMVLTMPDIENYHIKRSRHDVHYIYVQHSLASLHMIYRKDAFDHYDTLFCAGPHHRREARALEAAAGSKPKVLVDHGYGRLGDIIKERGKNQVVSFNPDSTVHVLIAPSWGEHGVIETIGLPLVNGLITAGFKVTLRPHPQTYKLSPDSVARIVEKHGENSLFNVERDVAGQETLHQSHIMISDWSGAAIEYAFALEKPVLFIDVPRKINNPDYELLGIEPFEVSVRQEIGMVVDPAEIEVIPEKISEMLSGGEDAPKSRYRRDDFVFNVGEQDRVGALAILDTVQNKSR